MRTLIVVLLGLAMAGCGGWQLRGAQFAKLGIKAVELRTSAAPTLYAELAEALVYSGVTLAQAGTPADVVVVVSNEEFARRVLSVDAGTGKVREVELALRVQFQLLGPDGAELTQLSRLQWERDFVFDELAVLGTVEQEALLRQSLAEDAAHSILLRLDSVRPANATAAAVQ